MCGEGVLFGRAKSISKTKDPSGPNGCGSCWVFMEGAVTERTGGSPDRLAIRRGLGTLCRLRAVLSRVSGVGALEKRLPLRIRSLRSRITNLDAHVRGVGTSVRRLGSGVTAGGVRVRATGASIRGCGTRRSGIHGGHRCSILAGRVRFRSLRVRLYRGHVGRCVTTRGTGDRRVRRDGRSLSREGGSLRTGGSRLRRVISRAGRRRRGLERGTGMLRAAVRPHLLRTFGHVHGGSQGKLKVMCIRHSTYNNYFGGVPPRGRLSVHVHGGVVMYRCYNHVVVSPRLTNIVTRRRLRAIGEWCVS